MLLTLWCSWAVAGYQTGTEKLAACLHYNVNNYEKKWKKLPVGPIILKANKAILFIISQ